MVNDVAYRVPDPLISFSDYAPDTHGWLSLSHGVVTFSTSVMFTHIGACIMVDANNTGINSHKSVTDLEVLIFA